MNTHFKDIILRSTGAQDLTIKEQVQDLWSGYGKILRIALHGANIKSAIIKHVQIPTQSNHPRGWNTTLSHQRKLKSYQVEMYWYKHYSKKSTARLPICYAQQHGREMLIILEDLDASGFSERKQVVSWTEIESGLKWLAQFHASYLGVEPKGLWQVGTYWHLDTRPQELSALKDEELKAAAPLIDQKLNACRFQTLVHGDAKLANFCFSPNGNIAAVDFQYVGGGCGIKDVAYFIGSCLDETDCERLEGKILDTYFTFLQQALRQKNELLELEWRSLYRVAWADFHRFLKGWSPDHWKINAYSERVTREVIANL